MTIEEQIFKAALAGDEDFARTLVAELNRSELADLADTLDMLDELITERS